MNRSIEVRDQAASLTTGGAGSFDRLECPVPRGGPSSLIGLDVARAVLRPGDTHLDPGRQVGDRLGGQLGLRGHLDRPSCRIASTSGLSSGRPGTTTGPASFPSAGPPASRAAAPTPASWGRDTRAILDQDRADPRFEELDLLG